MSAQTKTATFNGEWTDENGVTWLSRNLVDPERKRAWGRKHPGQPWPWPSYGPDHEVTWPRLHHISHEVTGCGTPPVPGKVRAMLLRGVPVRGKGGGVREYDLWVYHPDDLREQAQPDRKARAGAADRLQDERGRWVLSPREVARRLGIDNTLVTTYRQKGIPWIPGRKPETVKLPRLGAVGGRVEDYWLETDVAEILAARQALPVLPPDLLPGAAVGLSNKTVLKMGREKAVCRMERVERRKEKPRKVGYTRLRRLVPAEDVREYHAARVQAPPRPPLTMTVKEVARLFKISETQVLTLFPRSQRREGKMLCEYRRGGKPMVQLRSGPFYIPSAKVKRVWARQRPGIPWPLQEQVQPTATAGG
jgi:hypothetical protein